MDENDHQEDPRVAQLLLKILSDSHTSGADLLIKLGVDLEDLRNTLVGKIISMDEVEGNLADSHKVREVLALAEEESHKRGSKQVRSMDLVLALLRVPGGPVAEVFREFDLSYEKVVSRIAEYTEQDRTTGLETLLSDKQPGQVVFGSEVAGDENKDDLHELIEAWPQLSPALRSGIIAMIRDALNK
jgi:ATP-dependent Clp protease ATP-binding subunit ClpA